MSKQTPVKKSKRRLKRSARRSIAALLMVTAIGVAAVPVPENYATDGTTGTGTTGTTTVKVPDAYYYGGKDGTVEEICDAPSDGTALVKGNRQTYKSYIITTLSDNECQLDWQFEFFITELAGGKYGIISKYNNTYKRDTVVLNPNVYYEYNKVEKTVYEKYYTEHGDEEYYVDYEYNDEPSLENQEDKFLNEYFNVAYQEYIKKWEQYKKDYENWNKNPNKTQETKPTKPTELCKKVSELDDDQKLKYYCDKNKLSGCKLKKTIDKTQSDVTNYEIYIPQRIDGQTQSQELKFDSQGFNYLSTSSIIGIGNEAFKQTENVHYMTIPEEIKYIGVSAFEHSFIKEISFENVREICDYAFKDCAQLEKVNFGEGTVVIGTEAFLGTALTNVTFPATIKEIGPGAFARCSRLQIVDLSQITTRPVKIDEYAFYNAIALNEVKVMQAGSPNVTVNIDTVGDGAFAVESGVTGSMKTFTFPSKISKKGNGDVGLGDCTLAGRTNLEKVIMPADYGRATDTIIPDNTFFNCYNLSCVEFPDDGSGSCGLADYAPDKLFATISNPDFYVKGPEVDSSRNIATPRKTTWDAETAVSKIVPYLYVKNGLEYYEVSDGDYLLCVDNKGVLTSCTLKDDASGTKPIDLVIPAKVGNTKVTGIASDCFTDDEMNQRVKTLVIEDNSIATINDGVFKGWKNLQKVYIGNSVASIGASAFEGCEKLIDVTFNTPINGHSAFKIGADAFKTVGPELTFHGDIVEGYAPFEWAMDEGNVINEKDGIRVCYKSLTPTYLTVMYDANTKMVTLLDYPKYDQISDVLNEAHSIEIAAGKYGTYEAMMEARYYANYSSANYDAYRKTFAEAWKNAVNDATDPAAAKAAVYASADYGPWVNPDFCNKWESYLTTTDNTGNTGNTDNPDNPDTPDNSGDTADSALTALADMLFEPIVAQAAENPAAFYKTYPYNVVQNVESGNIYRAPTEEERALVEATKNVVVPVGVESIDAYGFSNGEGMEAAKNKNNARIYLDGSRIGFDSYNMYNNRNKTDLNTATDIMPGLFSGYYDDDYSTSETNYEQYKRGNDRVESITLGNVKYLPDYAFDSCERLKYVILGPDCADIGTAPFRGCYSLTTVGDNDYYKTDNGIVYSVNTDGSYTIEECLPARGNLVGGAQLGLSTDANIEKVSAIKEGAFEECKFINLVDLTNTAGLTAIPKDCFKNCSDLTRLSLPRSVNNIEEGAFVNDLKLVELTVPGTEVFISARAFESDPDKAWTTVRTYEDSSARRYADTYKDTYKLTYEQKKDEWKVIFLDSDYQQVGDAVYVEDGTYLSEDAIPTCPDKKDWTFEKWLGTNNIEVKDRITADTIFIAQGKSNTGMVNGKYPVMFLDQIDGKQIGDIQYIEPGKAAIAPQAPIHAGYTFEKWSSDEYNNVQKSLTIMAMYTGGTGTTSGGTTGTSGGTTGTSGATTGTSGTTTGTSGSSTSTTSTTSDTTSGSSTSTTSSTAAAAGQFVVMVIDGSGSGSYAPGTNVIITANTPAAGKVFSKWTVETEGVTLASVSLPTTTFVMPSSNVTIRAEYTDGTTAAATPTAMNTSTNSNKQDGNTRVDITKPGISNKDLASANVNGSSDNFVVKISETDEASRAVAAALTNKYGSLENILYYAMDISLYDSTGTTKITDTTGLSVDITIPLPDALLAYGGNNMTGAVVGYNPVESAQLEDLSEKFTTINGIPCVTFTATHFSPYTVYVDTGNLTEGMLDVTPKTGDPIHPKWFLSIGLACLSIILFIKKDKNTVKVKNA